MVYELDSAIRLLQMTQLWISLCKKSTAMREINYLRGNQSCGNLKIIKSTIIRIELTSLESQREKYNRIALH